MAKKPAWLKKPAVKMTLKVMSAISKCLLTIVLIGAITGSIVGCVLAVYVVTNFDGTTGIPDLTQINEHQTSIVMVKDLDTGEYVEGQRLQGVKQIWKNLDEMPLYMQQAVIAIEDERFETHYGVDWKRTISAFANLILHFSSTEYGGSTITQQLIKVLTEENDHRIERKITEILRAIEMEKIYTKDQIIQAYLNVLPLSSGIKGVGAAANYYFGVDAEDLTLAQCAVIASITQNPSKYDPYRHPENVRSRQRTVLYKMHQLGFITDDEYIQACGEELIFQSSVKVVDVQDYYMDTLIEDVINDLMEEYGYAENYAENLVYFGGLTIYSCENEELQAKVEAIYADDSNFPAARNDEEQPLQAALYVTDYEGKMVAVVGGRGEKTANRIQNRATSSKRQPGSAIKPLSVYASAIQYNLIHFSSQVQDCYITLSNGEKWPRNVGQSTPTDRGMTLVDKALQQSMNTVAARLAQQLTPQRCFDFMTNQLHFSTLVKSDGEGHTDIDLSPMALGGLTDGVYAREMAAAYQIFGNGGVYYEPYSYEKVEMGGQTILPKGSRMTNTALDEDSAYVMNRLLQHVITGRTGATGANGAVGRQLKKDWAAWEVFAKTGTTQNNNDSYFVGGTPYYVAASWVGYDYNKSLTDTQKAYARSLWSQAMKVIHEGLSPTGFTKKGNTVEAYYCMTTGQLATDACPDKELGVYKPENVPGACTAHGTVEPEPPTVSEEPGTTEPLVTTQPPAVSSDSSTTAPPESEAPEEPDSSVETAA